MKLTYSSSFLYQDAGVKYGINNAAKKEQSGFVKKAIQNVETKIDAKEYGFVNILSDKQMIKELNRAFQSIRWAKTLVVIGIGGSDLGARAVQKAVESEHPALDVFFHGDSTDPIALTRAYSN
jgi:glucose-6-phosphate isomerase